MIKSLVGVLRDCFTRHRAVGTFRYQSDDLNNAQNSFKGLQVYLDDVSEHQLNITDGTFTSEFQIMVLGHVERPKEIIDVQDEAYTLAASVVERLDRSYYGSLRVHDYSIMTVSHVTDDDSAGVRLTLVLQTPNPADLCSEDIWEEPKEDENEPLLELNPITLPKRRLC